MNNEHENLSRNDEKIRQILGSLEKVDAPSNFDFQLKSKIANRKSTRQSPLFWRYFLIGAPSLACVTLVAFFAFNRNVPPIQTVAIESDKVEIKAIEQIKTPDVANVEVAVKPLDENKTYGKPVPVVESKSVDEKIYAKIKTPQNIKPESKPILPKKSAVKENFSSDIAATDIQKPLVPKGLNGNPANTQINATDTVFEIESLLKDLGIETTEESGKLKVKTIRKNSSAERSGIKSNDLIDAIDNQKITPKETRKKSFDAKSINVTRDGKSLELKLQQ